MPPRKKNCLQQGGVDQATSTTANPQDGKNTQTRKELVERFEKAKVSISTLPSKSKRSLSQEILKLEKLISKDNVSDYPLIKETLIDIEYQISNAKNAAQATSTSLTRKLDMLSSFIKSDKTISPNAKKDFQSKVRSLSNSIDDKDIYGDELKKKIKELENLKDDLVEKYKPTEIPKYKIELDQIKNDIKRNKYIPKDKKQEVYSKISNLLKSIKNNEVSSEDIDDKVEELHDFKINLEETYKEKSTKGADELNAELEKSKKEVFDKVENVATDLISRKGDFYENIDDKYANEKSKISSGFEKIERLFGRVYVKAYDEEESVITDKVVEKTDFKSLLEEMKLKFPINQDDINTRVRELNNIQSPNDDVLKYKRLFLQAYQLRLFIDRLKRVLQDGTNDKIELYRSILQVIVDKLPLDDQEKKDITTLIQSKELVQKLQEDSLVLLQKWINFNEVYEGELNEDFLEIKEEKPQSDAADEPSSDAAEEPPSDAVEEPSSGKEEQPSSDAADELPSGEEEQPSSDAVEEPPSGKEEQPSSDDEEQPDFEEFLTKPLLPSDSLKQEIQGYIDNVKDEDIKLKLQNMLGFVNLLDEANSELDNEKIDENVILFFKVLFYINDGVGKKAAPEIKTSLPPIPGAKQNPNISTPHDTRSNFLNLDYVKQIKLTKKIEFGESLNNTVEAQRLADLIVQWLDFSNKDNNYKLAQIKDVQSGGASTDNLVKFIEILLEIQAIYEDLSGKIKDSSASLKNKVFSIFTSDQQKEFKDIEVLQEEINKIISTLKGYLQTLQTLNKLGEELESAKTEAQVKTIKDKLKKLTTSTLLQTPTFTDIQTVSPKEAPPSIDIKEYETKVNDLAKKLKEMKTTDVSRKSASMKLLEAQRLVNQYKVNKATSEQVITVVSEAEQGILAAELDQPSEQPVQQQASQQQPFWTVQQTQEIASSQPSKAAVVVSQVSGAFSKTAREEAHWKKVEHILSQYQDFIDDQDSNQARWTKDRINVFTYEDDIKRNIEASRQKDAPSSQMKRAFKEASRIVESNVNNTYNLALKVLEEVKLFFIKEHRQDMNFIKNYIQRRITSQDETIKSRVNKLQGQLSKIHETLERMTNQFFGRVIAKVDHIEGKIPLIKSMEYAEEGKITELEAFIVSKRKKIQDIKSKILSIYNLNYSMVDVLFDAQFIVMYVIKGLRILLMYIALFLATRIFIPMYEQAVYDNKSNPPSLLKYMAIFLAFDIAFNSFLVVALFLLMFIFKSSDNVFPIDKYLFQKYLMDYIVSTTVLLIFSFLVSRVITKKKYFKYKYEGARAIRALENIMFQMGVIILLVPFFWIL